MTLDKAKFEGMVKSLPFCSPHQLDNIKNRVGVFLTNGSKGYERKEDQNRTFYQAIEQSLSSLNISSQPYAVFVKQSYYPSFHRDAPKVLAFVYHHAPSLDRSGRMRLYQILCHCLIRDLQNQQASISIGTVCKNIHRMPQVFGDAFPGYIEAGLIDWLVSNA